MSLCFLLWTVCGFAQTQPDIQANILVLKKQLTSNLADTTRSRLCYKLGKQYEEKNIDSCLYFLNQSLQLAQKAHAPNAAAQAMFRLGYTNLYYVKDETKAIQWFNKGIVIAKKNNDNDNLAQCYQYLGIISFHQQIGNPEELLLKALAYAKKGNDWKVQSESYEVLFQYYQDVKKYTQAKEITVAMLAISKKHDIDTWFSQSLDYCDLLEEQQKTQQAFEIYKKLDLYKNKLKMSKGYFVYMNDVARLETLLKNYPQAEAILLKVLEVEKQKSRVDTFHLSHIFRHLKNLYVVQGAFEKAYQVSENYAEVRLWLAHKRQTQDSKLQMTQLKAASDLEKKQREISLLSEQKKQQLLLLFAAILVATLLIVFMLVLQRNKRRIENQRTELSRLNNTKDKLFAILSHDLRSPVGSLKNYMMLIDWGALSQDEFAASAQGLNNQLSNVHAMLENVLNWSVSQMGGMQPNIEPNLIFTIIEEQINLLASVAESKQIKIINQIPANAQLLTDKNHLSIIVRNLLQNALKFTNAGGEISFNYVKKEGFGEISVKDNGIGMSEKRLSNLFKIEKNTTRAGTAQEQGTGLGLVLVKDLVEANGGHITVSSTLAMGTTFMVEFKL